MDKYASTFAMIKSINSKNEEEQIDFVKQDYKNIMYIKNPSVKVQIEAVNQHGLAIIYIENLSEEVKLIAIRNSSKAIMYIDNPSEEVKQEALKWSAYKAMKYFTYSVQEQLNAVRDNPIAFNYVDLKLREIQEEAIHQRAIRFINFDKLEEEEIIKIYTDAVKESGYLIKYVNIDKLVHHKSKYFDLCLLAVKENSFSIEQMDFRQMNNKQAEQIQLESIKVDARSIQFITKPSDNVIITAIQQGFLQNINILDMVRGHLSQKVHMFIDNIIDNKVIDNKVIDKVIDNKVIDKVVI